MYTIAIPKRFFACLSVCLCLFVCLFAGTMEVKDFVAEAQVMKKIQHPNLLQLYAVCALEEPIYIVTELMKHGSLLEYMRHGKGQTLTLHQMIDMVAQIACGKCMATPSSVDPLPYTRTDSDDWNPDWRAGL